MGAAITPLDTTPRALADGLDTLVQGLLEADRESAAVLATARDALRVISWNRWAAQVNARTARQTRLHAIRRHQGWRARR